MGSILPQLTARLQVNVTEVAKRRIHVAARARDVEAGQIVTELAMERLPAIPDEKKIAQASTSKSDAA